MEGNGVNANGPFNPKNLFEDELPEGTPDVREEIASVREQLKKTRSELSHTRQRMDRREREFESRMLYSGIVLVVTLLACAGLGATLWYRVPLLRASAEPTVNPPQIAKLPAAAEERLDSIE